ncbi:YjbH domain-containing protein [Celeribacter arenosi]|uniref:YjbH domain-containing protein n=1 Tax=Celeribacter arenosi TaxID=792649 RepID=A0ABP7K0A2_9RHOB
MGSACAETGANAVTKTNSFLRTVVCAGSVIGVASPAWPETLESTRYGLYGNPGIIDMPSAEVAPDGELSLSHIRFGPTVRTSLTFQIAPRLSGSLIYSGTKNLTDDYDVYWDRSFDLAYRLVDETEWRPAVNIGLRDFLGTGLLGGEYIVATKSIGDKLRVTGGLGWGRLASYNPTSLSFGTRPAITSVNTGGTPNYDQWFRGPVAVFGGLTYAVNDKLTLMAEYSSDAYEQEVDRGIYEHNSPVNVGLNYRIRDSYNLTAAYVSGSKLAFAITGTLNPKKPRVSGGIEQAPLPVRVRPSPSADPLGWSGKWIEDGTDEPGIRKSVAEAMSKEGLVLEAMSLTSTRTEVRFRNTRYPARAEALGRLSRMMSRAFPPSVETFVLTEVVNGVPTHSTVISRRDLERYEFEPAGTMLEAVTFADPLSLQSDRLVAVDGVYPKLRWSVGPYLAASLFDPDTPVRFDAGVRARVKYELARGLTLNGAASVKLTGNISDNSVAVSDAELPVVRRDSSLYSDRVQLENLTTNWYARPGKNLYSRVSVGYLERMYGGVSGEVLWKQPLNRFALGAEVNYAAKRDPDSLFGFDDYDTVTGHVSAYYDFGNGYHGQVDMGRYLAGDWGATVSVDREFNNGFRVGAYATLTDVPFDEFGEGSFDKGIRITMPVDWFVGTPTLEKNDVVLQSLTRDGGARLNVSGRLYEQIRATQGAEIEDRWGRFWR